MVKNEFKIGDLVRINTSYYIPPNSVGLVFKKTIKINNSFCYKVFIPKTLKIYRRVGDGMKLLK